MYYYARLLPTLLLLLLLLLLLPANMGTLPQFYEFNMNFSLHQLHLKRPTIVAYIIKNIVC